jgi:hypothetical protein
MHWKSATAISLAMITWIVLGADRTASPNSVQAVGVQNSEAHPVVLELFTSEGCSSCPPADALLKRLDEAGRIGDADIIAIEEHVDYWDHQGWRDPFSSRDWTERQEQYSRALHHDGVFTPELVVNGLNDLILNSEGEVLQQLGQAAKASDIAVRIASINMLPKSAEFTINVETTSTDARSADLWLAVSERGLSSNVLRGENEGRNLSHAPVLRSLTRVKAQHADSSGPAEYKATIGLDSSWKRENLRFVAFMQDRKSLHILGATAAAIRN